MFLSLIIEVLNFNEFEFSNPKFKFNCRHEGGVSQMSTISLHTQTPVISL